MSDEGARSVRGAIEGAGRAFGVIDGGKGGGPPQPPDQFAPSGQIPCPLTMLGHLDGHFHFLDAEGQKRHLGARALGNRHELLALFLGNDAWLRQEFPKKANVKRQEDGQEIVVEVVVDFAINRAVQYLQKRCGEAGLYGEHVVLRSPGVWPGSDGLPIVHCGDQVMIDGQWIKAGSRTREQVWAAAAPVPRPGTPCSVEFPKKLQDDLKELWNFRKGGAEIAVMGLICAGYYGASINWRPAGFLLGSSGGGKSALLKIIRSVSPMHHYTNDTSKAGVEQAINGRAMPIFVDETADKADQTGARALLDMVVSASGGEGTRGVRGGADGHARTFQIAGSIIYAAVSPPDMQPQHLGRFTLVEVKKPEAGSDNSDAHKALAEECRKQGPALWGRALQGAERYGKTLTVFRKALSDSGCQPREMDQLGALLAGWWILTEESVPTAHQGKVGVSALEAFVRDADEVVADDGPQRMMRHLKSSMVQLHRTTDRMQIGNLIGRALKSYRDIDESGFGDTARHVLADHGIRVIRADDTAVDKKGRSAPRMASGDGVWFAPGAVELRARFKASEWEGDRWVYELKRFESAREPKVLVRIGSLVGRCIWVGADELGYTDWEE